MYRMHTLCPVTKAIHTVVPVLRYRFRLFCWSFGCHKFCMPGCTIIQSEQMWRHLSTLEPTDGSSCTLQFFWEVDIQTLLVWGRRWTLLYHLLNEMLCKRELPCQPSPQGKSKCLSQDQVSGSESHAHSGVWDKCSSLSKGQCFKRIHPFSFVCHSWLQCRNQITSCFTWKEFKHLMDLTGEGLISLTLPMLPVRDLFLEKIETASDWCTRIWSSNMGLFLMQKEWKNLN